MLSTTSYNRTNGRSSAFTLIELLVVVAIITLLIAILVPSLASAKRLSLQAKCGAQLKGLGSAMGVFNGDYGRIPVAGRGVNSTTDSGQAGTTDGPRSLLWYKYYPAVLSPDDPETSSTPGDGKWTGLPNSMANYIGGNKSKLLACPATSNVNAMSVFWTDTLAAGNPSAVKVPQWLGNYAAFMGDPGNTYPGLTSFYRQTTSTYAATGTNYDKLETPLKLANLVPTMILMQDLQYLDNTGKAFGNHPKSNTGLTADNYSVVKIYTSGSYSGSKITDMSGSNVLFADFHVEFIKTNDLTPVYASSGTASTDKVLFVGTSK